MNYFQRWDSLYSFIYKIRKNHPASTFYIYKIGGQYTHKSNKTIPDNNNACVLDLVFDQCSRIVTVKHLFYKITAEPS